MHFRTARLAILPASCLTTCWLTACLLSATAWAQAPNTRDSALASAAIAGAAAALPPIAPNGMKILPLAEVHRGQRGVAYTVFEGVVPEPMEMEILGVLKDAIGPGQDMILARLHGKKPDYTGVVAGMSGSPVYVDDRLIGALSYRIGQFSKEPICGITPIEQMFEVKDGQAAGGMRAAGSARDQRGPAATVEGGQIGTVEGTGANSEVQPIETALVLGGFSQQAVELFGDKFRALGMTPMTGLGGAAAAGTRQPEPIVPGSAVSAIMVRGDLSMAGTCTVTYVDADQLLACGHPITQFGPVAMPMTKAEVVATLPSPLNAFKIVNTTETVGEFTQDRASAILGRFRETARMIPVSVEVASDATSNHDGHANDERAATESGVALHRASTPMPSVAGHTMHFEVLDNRALTPSAMLMSVYQSLAGTNRSANETSYRMSGELTIGGQPPVRLAGVMSPSETGSAAVAAALYINDRFGRLYENSEDQPEVTALRLRMESSPERRTGVLDGVRLGSSEVRAGDTLEVEATVRPYQAEARVERLKIQLPETLTPGPMRIVVSDGATVDKLTGLAANSQAHPLALTDAVAQMNRMHDNDRLYVTLLDHVPQAALDADAMPGVPLSMANVLEPLKTGQRMQLTGESAIEAGSVATGYAVSGSQVLIIQVR